MTAISTSRQQTETQAAILAELGKTGFCVLRDVYEAPDAAVRMRQQVAALFETLDTAALDSDSSDPNYGCSRSAIFHRFPQLRWIIMNPEIHRAFRSIIGGPYTIVPAVAMKDLYTRWHRDTDSIMRVDDTFLFTQPSRPRQVAIYLQDAGPEGGGLMARVGSHNDLPIQLKMQRLSRGASKKWRFNPVRLAQLALYRLLARKLARQRRNRIETIVPTRSADIAVFDFAVEHRAVPMPPTGAPALDKLAIFFSIVPQTELGSRYLDFLCNYKNTSVMSMYKADETMQKEAAALGFRFW